MQEIQVNEITKLTPTKPNVLVVANEMTEPILNGDVDAIEFIVRCQFGINVLTESMKIAKQNALKSFTGNRTVLGAKVEVTETGIDYNYSANYEWKELDDKIKKLIEKRKVIEEQIKTATKTNSMILNGDEIIASPVTKESTTSIKITLGK
jgi:hypothetical protein